MIGEHKLVESILTTFLRDRKEARDRYAEKFGVSIMDQCIEQELENLLEVAMREQREAVVTVPARLVLALVLRPRGTGRRPPPMEIWRRHAQITAITQASRRWAELIADGVTSKKAKHAAALEAHDAFKRTAKLGIETIKDKMRLAKAEATLKSR